MTTAARFRSASLAIGIALFGLAWGASDAVAALPPMEGGAQTGAISLDLGEADAPAWAGPSEGLCSLALPPREEESVAGAGEEIQLAGPVRRSARRTSRRTSRRVSRRR
jgi:hypothetical protein